MNNDVFSVYSHTTGEEPTYKYIGRFTIKNNELKIDEDSTGLIKQMLPEGQINELTINRISRLQHHNYLVIQSYTEVLQNMQTAEEDSDSFDFYPEGGEEAPQRVKFVNGVATMNGHPLSNDELDLIVERVLAGKGIIRFSN